MSVKSAAAEPGHVSDRRRHVHRQMTWIGSVCPVGASAIVALLVCAGMAACRQAQPPPAATPAPLPQTTGAITLSGLRAPVRVIRDTWGVPHIFAANADDLFFAQGFIQAQDRLFQM